MSLDGQFAFEATTDGVTVRVQPLYAPDQSEPQRQFWAWHYHIRLENHRTDQVQLLDRHWIITNGRGQINEVRGDGVVGEQPVLPPGGKYDYVSGCPLNTPMGQMQGSFGMVDASGQRFKVEIPVFDLISPDLRGAVN